MLVRSFSFTFAILLSSASAFAQIDCNRLMKFYEADQRPSLDAFSDYNQKRLNYIYPDLYQLAKSDNEKYELTHTLEFLELQNNRQKLFSEFETQFKAAYLVFATKGLPTDEIHDYFRSIVRNDLEQAKSVADKMLARFPADKQEVLSRRAGIHSSKDPFWTTYKGNPEVKYSIIDYQDRDNDLAKGALVTPDRSTQLGKMAMGMSDVHGVRIATVPEAIERLNSNGFSTRQAKFKDLETPGTEVIEGPMIVIPKTNVEYNKISQTTKHESRHAYHNTQRQLKSSSPLDSHSIAISGNTLSSTPGYNVYASDEELSTHSRDLMDAFRTSNREILELYKTQETIPVNHLIDLIYAHSKATTLNKIASQTVQVTTESLEELAVLEKISVVDLRYFGISLEDEGYKISFRVKNRFLRNNFIAAKEQRSVVTQFVVAFEPYQAELLKFQNELLKEVDPIILKKGEADPKDEKYQSILLSTHHEAAKKVNPELIQKANETLTAVMKILEVRNAETQGVAQVTETKSAAVLRRLGDFFKGQDLNLTRDQYLKLRDLLADPSTTFNGIVKKDPVETQKALEVIRQKRDARK